MVSQPYVKWSDQFSLSPSALVLEQNAMSDRGCLLSGTAGIDIKPQWSNTFQMCNPCQLQQNILKKIVFKESVSYFMAIKCVHNHKWKRGVVSPMHM